MKTSITNSHDRDTRQGSNVTNWRRSQIRDTGKQRETELQMKTQGATSPKVKLLGLPQPILFSAGKSQPHDHQQVYDRR